MAAAAVVASLVEAVETVVVVRRGKSIKTEKKRKPERRNSLRQNGVGCVIISAGNAKATAARYVTQRSASVARTWRHLNNPIEPRVESRV